MNNEAEFLKSWPSLAPAVWRLVNAARLTKELAEERAKRDKDCSPGKHCQVCHWTNTGCWNIGSELGAFWICQGCAKRQHEQLAAAQSAIAEQTREVIGEEFMVYDEALQRSYAELQSALAEKEEELAECRERNERDFRANELLALRVAKFEHSARAYEERFEACAKELSTERTAREEAEAQVQSVAKAAVDGFLERRSEINALHAQLLQAEQTTTVFQNAKYEALAMCDELQEKLQQARQVHSNIDALNAGITETLKARNAKLVKALEYYASDWYDFGKTAKKAITLNQTPESI